MHAKPVTLKPAGASEGPSGLLNLLGRSSPSNHIDLTMVETPGFDFITVFKKVLAQYEQRRGETPTKVAAPSRFELILSMRATRLQAEKMPQENQESVVVHHKITYCGIEKRCSKADVAKLTPSEHLSGCSGLESS